MFKKRGAILLQKILFVSLFLLPSFPLFSKIDLLNPFNSVGDILKDVSVNVYEQRIKYFDGVKKSFNEDFLKRKNALLAENSFFAKTVSERIDILKKDSFLSIEDKIETANALKDIYSEEKDVLDSCQALFEEHISFAEKNQDTLNEVLVKDRLDALSASSKYFIKDLEQVENEILENQASREKKSKLKASVELKRNDEESLFEFMKKDEESKKYKVTLQELKKTNPLNLGNESFFYFLDKLLSAKKLELQKLRIERCVLESNFLTKEIDLLKNKYKVLLEKSLKVIKSKLVVTPKDIESIAEEIVTVEQDINAEKDRLSKEISKKKEDKIKEAKLRDEVTRAIQKILKSNKDSFDNQAKFEELEISKLVKSIKIVLLEQERDHLEATRKTVSNSDSLLRFELLRARAFYYAFSDNEKALNEILKNIKEFVLPEISKQLETVRSELNSIEITLTEVAIDKKAAVKNKKDLLTAQKERASQSSKKDSQDPALLAMLNQSELDLDETSKVCNKTRILLLTFEKQRKSLQQQYEDFSREVLEMLGVKSLWTRSPDALTLENVVDAFKFVESFILKIFWDAKEKWNPSFIFAQFAAASASSYLHFFLYLLCWLLLGVLFYIFLSQSFKKLSDSLAAYYQGGFGKLLLHFLEFLSHNFPIFFAWLSIHISIQYSIKYLSFSFLNLDPFYRSVFYLLSIPFFFYYSHRFVLWIKETSYNMPYFFTEKTSTKNIVLSSVLLYCAALVFPFCWAIQNYTTYFTESMIIPVLHAAYSLLSLISVVLFLDQEDIVLLIPKTNDFYSALRSFITKFYYPILIFIVFIFSVFNRYVGYTNLGWKLLFVMPFSVAIIAGFIILQDAAKEFAASLLFNKSDNETDLVDKFEYSRTTFGIFVVTTFLVSCILTYAILSKIWTDNYNLLQLWKNVSENWTFQVGENSRLGLVQLFTFCTFIFSGYVIASIIDQVVLKKLFDIFKVDAGLENTISRIFLYFAIIVAVLVGIAAINLAEFVKYAFVGILIGIGLGLRDQIADIFSGILILLERQIEVGHYIDFNGIVGTVHKISIRSTTIRTTRNFFVSVPNKMLISQPVSNWGAGRVAVGMEFTIKVANGSADPEFICALIKKVVAENPVILKVPAIIARLEDFSEYGMTFFSRSFLSARRVREQWDVAASIRTELLKVFKEHGIEISYPNAVVHLAKDVKCAKADSLDDVFSIKLDQNNREDV